MNYVGFYVLEVTFPDPVLADFLTLLFSFVFFVVFRGIQYCLYF